MTATPAHPRSTWPQQLSLPGQTAAPEGPVDLRMMYLMHHAFRRDLTSFAAAAPLTPLEDRAAWQALARRWQLFSGALHHHHTGEDTWLWPELVARVDEADRAVLEAMEAEHAEIDPLLEGCAEGFAAMALGGSADTRAALAVRLVATRDALARHLRHEETDAMRLLQGCMTDAEWQAIDEERFKKTLPLRRLVPLVPWALHEVPADVRQGVFAETGALHRLIWLLTRRRFEREEGRAFGALRAG